MKSCPFCGEQILENANCCLHCLNVLNNKKTVQLPKLKNKKLATIITSTMLSITVALSGVFGVVFLSNGFGSGNGFFSSNGQMIVTEYVYDTSHKDADLSDGKKEQGGIKGFFNSVFGSNKNIDSSEHNAVDDDNSTNPSGSILPNYEGITPEIDDEVTDNTSSDPLIDLPIVPTPTPSDTPSSNPESDVVVDKYVPVEMQAKATTYSTFTLAGTSTRGLLCIASTNDVLNEICYLPNYIDMDLAQFWIDIYGENAVNTTNVHGVHANFFKNQPNVKKIVLPRNYSYFDSDAFEHLENLTDVYIMAKYSILIDSNYYALQRNITLHCRKDLIHSNSGKLVSEYYRNLGFANYVEWDGNIDNIE